MMKRIVRGISFRMVLGYLCLLIPLYTLLIIGQSRYMHSLRDQAVSSARAILTLNISSLDQEIRQINLFLYNFTTANDDYVSLQRRTDIDSGRYLLSFLDSNARLRQQLVACRYGGVMFMNVEDSDFHYVTVSDSLHEEKEEVKEDILQSPLIHVTCQWQVITLGGEKYLAHSFGYNQVFTGAALNLESFAEELEDTLGYEQAVVSIDPVEELEGDDHYLPFSAQIRKTSHRVCVYLNRDEIYQRIPLVHRIVYVISFLSVLFVPLLLLGSWRGIVKPLHRIEEALDRLAAGEQDYRIPDFPSSAEFENLQKSFNRMADEITSLKIEAYEQELEKEQVMLQNLQLQIGPHFLLNLFNQIFSMAQLEDYEGIQVMSLYLSRYFRYLFHSGKTASIGEEVEIVKSYIETMELRYPDCFETEWDLDETLLSARIPPLMLHNLVENAFKYAVQEGTETLIRIRLYREGNFAVLSVEDDGPGMEPEIAEGIRRREKIVKKDGTHVGIWNAVYRLKKFCGEESFLEVESVLSEGTTMRIGVPLEGNEDENIHTVDRGR